MTAHPAEQVPLAVHDEPLVRGTVVERPNRFVLRVRFDEDGTNGTEGEDGTEVDAGGEPVTDADGSVGRVFLGDPGALRAVEPGRTVLCTPVDDPERSTDYDAIAVEVEDVAISLRPVLANDLVAELIARGDLPEFQGYDVVTREPPLPDHGRTDFLLERDATGEGRGADTHRPERAYVEVKSCTHVDDGVAMFPDRQTERGRRHLRSLESLLDDRTACHVVFVVQRPDAERFRPFREVDPEFADLLARVNDEGVGIRALSVAFEPNADPPAYLLDDLSLPYDLV